MSVVWFYSQMWLRKGQQLKPNDLRWQSFYPHQNFNTFLEFEFVTLKAQGDSTTVSANWLTYTWWLIRDNHHGNRPSVWLIDISLYFQSLGKLLSYPLGVNNIRFSFTREAGLGTRTAHGNQYIYDRLDFVREVWGYGSVELCDLIATWVLLLPR